MKIETIFVVRPHVAPTQNDYRVITDGEFSLTKHIEEGITLRGLVLGVRSSFNVQYAADPEKIRFIMSRDEWLEWIATNEGQTYRSMAAKLRAGHSRSELLAMFIEADEVLWTE